MLEVHRTSNRLFPAAATFFPGEQAIRAPNVPADEGPADDYYPPLGYRLIQKALITANRRAAGISVEGRYVIPESAGPGPWNIRVGEPTVGGVLRQEDDTLLVHVRKSREVIPRGIFVGSWSPHNWFHWVVDTLPSVYLASLLPPEFDDFPLVLPDSGMAKPSWMEPLELVRANREIIHISANRYKEVENLVWIDSPTCPGPLPLEESRYPNFRLHGSAMRAYREHILRQLGLDGPREAPRRKIFLAREQRGNRPYNQTELIAMAAEYDFEPVFLETLDFRDSVESLLDAKHVIGPHGAGWANALFCQEGVRGLMWTWAEARRENWFANIAAIQNMDFTASLEVVHQGAGKLMPPELLRALLEEQRET